MNYSWTKHENFFLRLFYYYYFDYSIVYVGIQIYDGPIASVDYLNLVINIVSFINDWRFNSIFILLYLHNFILSIIFVVNIFIEEF